MSHEATRTDSDHQADHRTEHPGGEPPQAPAGPSPTPAELDQGLLLLRDGPVADAYNLLLLTSTALRTADPALARTACVHAMLAAWAAGDRDGYHRALDDLCAPTGPAGPADALWRGYRDGMRCVVDGDFARAKELLRPVLGVLTTRTGLPGLMSAGTIALMLGDLATARQLLGTALATARADRATALVPRILEHLAYAELREGSYHQARVHAEAGLAAVGEDGQRNVAAGLSAVLALAASIAGRPATVATHAQAALRVAHAHGLRQTSTLAEWAQARADLGHGNADHAAARLAPLVHAGPRQGHFGLWVMAVPCYVESAVLAGHDVDAQDMIDQYAVWAAMGADPQAPALLSRCRALVAGDGRSEELFTEALARHEKVNGPYEHARTHLAYGMWLRRRRRPGEARTQLRDAVLGFERSGADVWTEHARAELRAAGETPAAAPEPGPLNLLTPQQLRIARCVAEGATNREVARQLSISTRTVEYHLRNVFTHLGVRSRVALTRLLTD
ncbi:LuxR family transcriptional regulator [Streptomyces sp. V3I8]|uniref:LuxR family transcriptional regulator n=1 Tax=Streptomyces sp. V3I8 TaxID=3042279 RepID=UPI0027D8DF8A|nr:LuxR family transcriptional regulator [Streptomyces sp. V3I8]